MRGLALALIVAVAAAPSFAQDAPAPAKAAPKTKRVCKWIETGNPLDNKRLCREVALSAPPAPAADAQPAPAQTAMEAQQPH